MAAVFDLGGGFLTAPAGRSGQFTVAAALFALFAVLGRSHAAFVFAGLARVRGRLATFALLRQGGQ